MGRENPWLLVVLIGAIAWVANGWWVDYRAVRCGRPNPRGYPGTTPAGRAAVLLAAAGACLLLGAETWGEHALGLVHQQSRVSVLFGVYSLGAAFAEELIFRGYVVIENRGRAAFLAGVVGASLVFAALHPFLWEWTDAGLVLHSNTKAWFSTAMVFTNSLWFYAARFLPVNRTRSLLPCITAHATKNLGVFAVKYAQGFVSGWW
ncbi:MAG TPA: CPBP family intramembrane glutamic endopeptidase [Lacunisphaera sp.]|nr:CPBP family intramembrane glutamic endopeptidase [Lacunisphaera sp.]